MIVLAERDAGRRKEGDRGRAKRDAYARTGGVGKLGGSEAEADKKVEQSHRGHALPQPRRHTAPKLISKMEHLRQNAELTCIRKHS